VGRCSGCSPTMTDDGGSDVFRVTEPESSHGCGSRRKTTAGHSDRHAGRWRLSAGVTARSRSPLAAARPGDRPLFTRPLPECHGVIARAGYGSDAGMFTGSGPADCHRSRRSQSPPAPAGPGPAGQCLGHRDLDWHRAGRAEWTFQCPRCFRSTGKDPTARTGKDNFKLVGRG
jgi:hypothetical protein